MFHAQCNQVFWRDGQDYQLILTIHSNPPILGVQDLSVNEIAKQLVDTLNSKESDLHLFFPTRRL